MAGIDLSLSGLASGFDWKSFVEQIIAVERAPQEKLLQDQSTLNQRKAAYENVKTQLAELQTRVQALEDPTLYDSRAAQISDSAAGTASAVDGAVAGTFTFNVTQLATASRLAGAANQGSPLGATVGIDTLTLADAAFPITVSAGIFTVNGHQVTIATSDTIQQVLDKIGEATGGEVTAAYDIATDRIALTGSQEIVLGSATDTSNFLQAARLYNNGSGAITSTSALGSVRLAPTLAAANFATAVSGDGAGEFKINGVSIAFNTATDSVSDVLNRINSSGAGVTAAYDAVNDRFTLTSKVTGDIGIAVEDVTGNFLQATGLGGAALEHGKNMIYTVNGSDALISQSNTITESSSGIAGLSVTIFKANTDLTVTVGSDSEKIKGAIQSFIEEYNKVQSLIDSLTASSTDAKGVVTAGILAGESDADEIASRLRSGIYSPVTGLSGVIDHLADLGIVTNGNDNTISLDDADQLDGALTNQLADIKQFFTDATSGLATRLDKYLNRTIGDSGSLTAHQTLLTRQSSDIDLQVADMERLLQAEKERMTESFVAMETAQARLNQQLQFLLQQLGQAS